MSAEERPSALLSLLPRGDGQDSQNRVLARLSEPARRSWRLPVLAGAGLAAAAALAMVLWPPAQLDAQLAGAEWSSLQVSDHINMDFKGRGQLRGDEENASLDWTEGIVRIEVDPNEGVQFTVNTPEAQVSVLGTMFSVERAGEFTTVLVERGRVSVACLGGAMAVYGPGETASCPVLSAGALLARARSESPLEALATLDEGLAVEPSAVIEGEIRALRLETLLTLERHPEALAEARTYLLDPGPRELQVQHIAADLALQLEGCEGGVPQIEAMGEHATGVELVLMADCLPEQPERARAALERALELSPADSEVIQARLDRL